jgi:uncharacterized protein YcfJ
VDATEDKAHAIHSAVGEIDQACSNLLKVTLETKFPLRLANLKTSFTLSGAMLGVLGGGAIGALAGGGLALPAVAAVLGAVGNGIRFGGDIGFKRAMLKNSPLALRRGLPP